MTWVQKSQGIIILSVLIRTLSFVFLFSMPISVWFSEWMLWFIMEAFGILPNTKSDLMRLKLCNFSLFDPILCIMQDIELSREINDSFRQSAQARLKLPSGIEMNVHVLTTG